MNEGNSLKKRRCRYLENLDIVHVDWGFRIHLKNGLDIMKLGGGLHLCQEILLYWPGVHWDWECLFSYFWAFSCISYMQVLIITVIFHQWPFIFRSCTFLRSTLLRSILSNTMPKSVTNKSLF